MCGIAGILGTCTDRNSVVQTMLERQQHRGPDFQGNWSGEQISLGHNRLSIIDLTDSANQPMISSNGRFIIAFNGEIYNYKELKPLVNYNFKTNSDTEVILALYEKYSDKMLSFLNGMFSIAIWDSFENELFLARDRFGVKPLFYFGDYSKFIFASEIKSIIAAGVDNAPNERVWSDYLVNASYGQPSETFYKHIKQITPGKFIRVKLPISEIVEKSYYDFAERVRNQPVFKSVFELNEVYKELLRDAVKLRFVSDVPVGFNISGGLDSSILLSTINETQGVDSKSVGAYTFYTGDEKYDELPWVKSLLSTTKNQLSSVLIQSHEIPELFQKVSYFQDEPFGGIPTLAYSKIFEMARANGVIVLMDGQGLDETWAGYDYYKTQSESKVQGIRGLPTKPNVLQPDFLNLARNNQYPRPFDEELLNKQYRDLFFTKIPRALRFNDRISMMHGTELREPFLDYRLVEIGFAQNSEMKINNDQGKWFLRQMNKKQIGDIALAPKRPIQTPQREWLAGPLRDFVRDSISELAGSPWFNNSQLTQELDKYFNGDVSNSFFIWQWLSAAVIYE